MNILFYLPPSTLNRCFARADLDRLHREHRLWQVQDDVPTALLEAWATYAAAADALVTGWGTPSITEAMLDHAPRLKLITHSAGSVRGLLPESFWSRGIRLTTANDALGLGVAETTLGLIITGLKGVFTTSTETRRGLWSQSQAGGFPVRELFDVTVGIIGASRVGLHLIRLLRNFETRVVVYDPYLSEARATELGVERATLDQLLQQSDVVSLHAPALPSTRHMLGRDQFRLLKDGALFINTARGSLVDEKALVVELQTGRLFAFLDVTDPEPPAADHPFRHLPNVVLTPHLAGAVSNGCLRQGRLTVDHLLAFAANQPMPGEITEQQAAIMA